MKRPLAWIAGLLSILINIASSGQSVPSGSSKSLLWSITGNNLRKPSFLFGTIHLICVDDYLWTKAMKESLDKSDKVCFEMDLGDPSLLLKVAAGLMDTSGKKLEEYFTSDQYKKIGKYMRDSMGIDITLFESMKPIALQSVFATSGVNCTNPTSYEDSILKTARNANKEITGLETPQEQLTALEHIPIDSIVQQLIDEVQSTEQNDSEYNKLISAYKKQDLPLLYKLITTSSEPGDEMGVLLEDRNRKWIPRMSDFMNKESVFFAVGAGHLWGDMGVINLLQKAGYTVKPLK